MELVFSQQIVEKHSQIKSHETPANVSRVVPCKRSDGRTHTHDKLIFAFHDTSNALKTGKQGNRALKLTDY